MVPGLSVFGGFPTQAYVVLDGNTSLLPIAFSAEGTSSFETDWSCPTGLYLSDNLPILMVNVFLTSFPFESTAITSTFLTVSAFSVVLPLKERYPF